MGAESSSLQDLKVDDSVTQTADRGWTLYSAKDSEGSKVSVFVYSNQSHQNSRFMENAAKQLKLLRHPCILRFLSWKKTGEGGLLVTEPVKPLESVIDSLTAVEICAGLYNIIDAVGFLHEKGNMSHNNLSISSVFVAKDGSWRLGGMECVCHYDQITPSFLQSCASLRDKQTIPPEEQKTISIVSKECRHARDAYGIGILCDQLLTFLKELGDSSSTLTFEKRIQQDFLNPDPKQRPKISTLLQDRLFKNEFLEIINFLRQITLKSEQEKKEFFGGVVEKLYSLPQEVVGARLARPLLSRFVLIDATAELELLPHLLTPCIERGEFEEGSLNPILCEDLFRTHVIPELFKIFHVRDAHIRLIILKYFHAFMHLFDRRALKALILPQVLLGVKDLNDELVASSLHALAYMVPILGGEVVVGGARGKIFSEGKPGFALKTGHSKTENGRVEHNASQNGDSGGGRTLLDQVKMADREKRKEEERVRRKEEARRRAEERTRKREEKLLSLTQSEKERVQKIPSSHVDDEEENQADNSYEKEGNSPEVNSQQDGDWSNWGADHAVLSDADYDQEIENELAAMGGHPELQSQISNDSSIHSEHSGLPAEETKNAVNLDRTNVEKHTLEKHKLKKNPLILKTGKAKISDNTKSANISRPVDSKGNKDSFNEEWGGSWQEDASSTTSRSASITSDVSSVKSSTSSKAKPASKLGEEFDILSMDIKTSKQSSEFDYFAEMEPEIKPSGMSLLETLVAGEDSSRGSKSDSKSDDKLPSSLSNIASTSSKLSFNMDVANDQAEGWGEDGWGDEDLDIDTQAADS